MFHRHRWSDWSITERGKVFDHLGHCQIGNYLTQERFCPKCSKTEIDLQSTVYLQPHKFKLIPETKRVVPKHDKVT